MIAYTKRLEFEIKRCLDTPLRMFRILLNKHAATSRYQASGPNAYQGVKEAYFMDDMKQDDLAKVMKFANSLLAQPNFSVDSLPMQSLNVNEFIHAL